MHQSYWSRRPDELLRSLASSLSGLSRAEAEVRLARFGGNRIEKTDGTPVLRLLLRQYSSPLV
jgi:magnesium-transporting ATPase (P-type)